LLIPIIGFVLAYVPIRTYIPLHCNNNVPDNALLIISYNVCGYGGNYKYDQALDTVLNYFKTQNADIVCTQEDMSSKWNNAIERYAEIFPYNDTTRISTSSKIINSLGIHTRFPIIRKEVIPYHSPTNGSVAYYLNVDGDTIVVVNNHLESTHLNNEDRNRYKELIKGDVQRDTIPSETNLLIHKLAQAMTIREGHVDTVHHFVDSLKQLYPVIVCGDFNDTPISYTRHRMAEDLTDCYVETGMGLGLSFNQRGFNFRIDHLMCSSHFTPYQCKIDNKMDASDHYPLLCWLKKREKP
jgi:endonuclease/exonuclease/phosphatase (EEP) superfamily protein YafD